MSKKRTAEEAEKVLENTTQQADRTEKDWIVIRGGGDLATGSVQRLKRAGFKTLVLETEKPLAIRRKVALSEAVYEKTCEVEDVRAVLCPLDIASIEETLARGDVPVVIDPAAEILKLIRPAVLVDAIIAKKNLGTTRDMGRFGTVALGPGFTAGEDVDIVIETARGHNLGRLIFEGPASPNTGLPGNIGGHTAERVIHAPAGGVLEPVRKIGDRVKKGETLAWIGETPVIATLDGVLRGLIRPGLEVKKGLKIADIDPRYEEQKNCFTISDKSRSLGGAVLEAVMILLHKGGEH